jgi:hypothetical protein
MYSFWALYIVKDEKAHYLELDDATEISYEWLSPMWNTETSTTWDFSLPRTPHNEELLLPSSANGELIPLNEGRLQGYLTGLPWQETDEAYWGLLTVLSASERRIKVQFLQKSLFEQKLEVPVREIKVSIAKDHRVEALSSVWASGEAWENGKLCKNAIIAWNILTLLEQIATWCGYSCKSNFYLIEKIYLVSNNYNAMGKAKIVVNKRPEREKYHLDDIRENGKYQSGYVVEYAHLSNTEEQSLQSSRIALGLVRDMLRLFCAQMLITEYVLGANKTPKVIYRGVYVNTARRYFGELSSYEWVQAPYPELQDVAERRNEAFSLQERNYLFPIIAMEEGKGLEFREYPAHDRSSMHYCFYNDVFDGGAFYYQSRCGGRTYYVPWPDEFPYRYAYFRTPNPDYTNTVNLHPNSHLCDCTPTGVAVSTSQYGVDTEHGTWKYLGEYLQTRNPHVYGRGAQRVALSFQRGRFIAITLGKEGVPTHGDTLINSCIRVSNRTNTVFFDRTKSLQAQAFCEALSISDLNLYSDDFAPDTKFTLKSYLLPFLNKTHPKPPKPYDPPDDNLPLPPGKDWDDDRRPHRPIPRKPYTPYSMHSVSALQSVDGESILDKKKKFHDTSVRMVDKQKLFYAGAYFHLNTVPPLPCLEVEPYDPSKPRAERLFIAGLQKTNSRVEIEIHPNAYSVLPHIINRGKNEIGGTYYEESLTNDLPLDDLVLPYFRHLWHAVEGELRSWEEEEVFKYMTEFNYPAMNDQAHIGNQRIKRVTMVLRRNECRIKSVRVIQFNRMATEDEFNKFLQ